MQVTVYANTNPPDDPFVFADCRWKVGDFGALHIFRAPNAGPTEMVAAFGAGSWYLVLADAEVVAA